MVRFFSSHELCYDEEFCEMEGKKGKKERKKGLVALVYHGD